MTASAGGSLYPYLWKLVTGKEEDYRAWKVGEAIEDTHWMGRSQGKSQIRAVATSSCCCCCYYPDMGIKYTHTRTHVSNKKRWQKKGEREKREKELAVECVFKMLHNANTHLKPAVVIKKKIRALSWRPGQAQFAHIYKIYHALYAHVPPPQKKKESKLTTGWPAGQRECALS